MLGRNFLRSEAVICLAANYQEFCLLIICESFVVSQKKKEMSNTYGQILSL